MTMATPRTASAVPAAFLMSSLSFMISQSSSTANGIWICRIRLAAVAGIASLLRPQNRRAPWIVTEKAEMAMIEAHGVLSFSRWVRLRTMAMPP
jgi:hypothetical protein